MDLTVRLPPPSTLGLGLGLSKSNPLPFEVYISKTGDLGNPPKSTGGGLVSLGKLIPDKDGFGDMFKEVEGELWEWIGRGCVVEAGIGGDKGLNKDDGEGGGGIFAGVVARSAGVWGNEKTVCACSGRTMWEEGREMEKKGQL